MVAMAMVAVRVAPIATSLSRKSNSAIPHSHPLSTFVFLKKANLGALDLLAGATGAMGTSGAFPRLSAGPSLMAIAVEAGPAMLIVCDFDAGCY